MGEAGLPGGPAGLLRQPSRPRGWSGQRDSNPRHQAWEACTLPAELCPLNAQQVFLINFGKNVKAFSGLRPDSCASPAGSGPHSPCHSKKMRTRLKLFRSSSDRADKSWTWRSRCKQYPANKVPGRSSPSGLSSQRRWPCCFCKRRDTAPQTHLQRLPTPRDRRKP